MAIDPSTAGPPPSLTDPVTLLSLLATVVLLLTAYFASLSLLPKTTSTKLRILYVWHAFDALTHLILEASFLYNNFFSYSLLSALPANALSLAPTPAGVYFLGQKDRLYGNIYGTNPFAKLWQEYAKADRRWGGADLNIISLELLTVFGAGPLAVYVTEKIRQGAGAEGGKGGIKSAKMWFWGSVLATGELYGGFMTFAPEWLSANSNLDTSNFMYLYLYLFFFNVLWVFLPGWFLYEAYYNIKAAFTRAEGTGKSKKSK
ncbi:MAG: hypothetical protein MMC33_005862 [Icmadophila ericetorum]|nr:hypothetical protein [Icmadophila ericetorum]